MDQHAQDPAFNIRVVNLSFGPDTARTYGVDPLAYAAEVAWRHGLVVVSASWDWKPRIRQLARNQMEQRVGLDGHRCC